MTDGTTPNLTNAIRLEQATQIVAAYVSNNAVSPGDLPLLIAETNKALQSLSAGADVEAPAQTLTPAVPIKKSITPDFIICLDDGRKFKLLKRHLTQLGMTPAEYRAKWGLPETYAMVSANYSATRSSLAKSNGLGRKSVVKPATSAKRTRKSKVEA